MFNLVFKLLRLYERFVHQIYSFIIKKQLKFCGKNVILKKGVMLVYPQNIHLDDYTQVGEYTQIKAGSKIKIGKYCQIASFVIIATGNHIIDGNLYYGNVVDRDIVIGDNVWVASNSIILPGIKIGDNSVIAAGAVVNKNVPANTIVGGVPAKIIGNVPVNKKMSLLI